MIAGQQVPTIGRIVIYRDNQGKRHAAIICADPEGDGPVDLIVFGFHGTSAFPVFAKQGDAKGEWQWPKRMASPGVSLVDESA